DVVAFGFNSHGQLGVGKSMDEMLYSPAPLKVTSGWGYLKPVSVSAGYWHSVVRVETGTLYCFGANANYECGNVYAGDRILVPVTMDLTNLENEKVTGVSCGDYFTVMIDASHRVFACGDGSQGQLGSGNMDEQQIPQQMDMRLVPGDKFKSIVAATSWTMLVL
ncbi:hypothetical protein KIPB_014699, partial [Kipferlia bialata]